MPRSTRPTTKPAFVLVVVADLSCSGAGSLVAREREPADRVRPRRRRRTMASAATTQSTRMTMTSMWNASAMPVGDPGDHPAAFAAHEPPRARLRRRPARCRRTAEESCSWIDRAPGGRPAPSGRTPRRPGRPMPGLGVCPDPPAGRAVRSSRCELRPPSPRSPPRRPHRRGRGRGSRRRARRRRQRRALRLPRADARGRCRRAALRRGAGCSCPRRDRHAAGRRGRPTRSRRVAFAAVVLGLLLLVRAIGPWPGDVIVWPLGAAMVGLAVLSTRPARRRSRAARLAVPRSPPARGRRRGRGALRHPARRARRGSSRASRASPRASPRSS